MMTMPAQTEEYRSARATSDQQRKKFARWMNEKVNAMFPDRFTSGTKIARAINLDRDALIGYMGGTRLPRRHGCVELAIALGCNLAEVLDAAGFPPLSRDGIATIAELEYMIDDALTHEGVANGEQIPWGREEALRRKALVHAALDYTGPWGDILADFLKKKTWPLFERIECISDQVEMLQWRESRRLAS